jgi:hypothetical protein
MLSFRVMLAVTCRDCGKSVIVADIRVLKWIAWLFVWQDGHIIGAICGACMARLIRTWNDKIYI